MKSRQITCLVLAGLLTTAQANAIFNPFTLCKNAWNGITKKVDEAKEYVQGFYKNHKKTAIATAVAGTTSLIAGAFLGYNLFKKAPKVQPKPSTSFFSAKNGLIAASIVGIIGGLSAYLWKRFFSKKTGPKKEKFVSYKQTNLPLVLSREEQHKQIEEKVRPRLLGLEKKKMINAAFFQVPKPMNGTAEQVIKQLLQNRGENQDVIVIINDASKNLNAKKQPPLALPALDGVVFGDDSPLTSDSENDSDGDAYDDPCDDLEEEEEGADDKMNWV